ncbi:MAG: hypothetical protein QOI39_1285, partial [Mycobacterium sp.]|nr:hypothetical protein [Mycobacterium sp.]
CWPPWAARDSSSPSRTTSARLADGGRLSERGAGDGLGLSPHHPPLSAYRDFMGWDVPWYPAQDSTDALLAGRRFAILVCYPRRGDTVFETYWTTGRRLEVMAASHGLLDMTVDRRQETWENSPAGWPQRWQSPANKSAPTDIPPPSGPA